MTNKNILGIAISFIAGILAAVWFGYKLPIVIALAIWGNNLERSNRK